MTSATSAAAFSLAAVLACGVLPRGALADDTTISATVEGGAEYDSNALRLNVADGDQLQVASGALVRSVGRVDVIRRTARRQRVRVRLLGGAKLFASDVTRDESTAVASAELRYDLGLPERPGIVSAGLTLFDMYGMTATSTARTFDNVDATLSLTLLGSGAHRLTASAGARRFGYDPDPDFSFSGIHYGARYSTTIWSGEQASTAEPTAVDVAASYRLEQRDYGGLAFSNGCVDGTVATPECFLPTRFARADLFHSLGAEVSYTGDRIYAARYELQVADSNSFGQSLVRHRLELTVTTELMWDTYLTAKAVAQYNVLVDSLSLAQDAEHVVFPFLGSYDDENRNAAVLHATRELSRRWAAELRLAGYTNEFSSAEVRYRRLTGYLGLVYRSGG